MAEKVGERLAKGWRRVGEGLAQGWRRVSGLPCTLQFRNSRGARLETRVCGSMAILSEVSKRGWRTHGVGARRSFLCPTDSGLFSAPYFLPMRRGTQFWGPLLRLYFGPCYVFKELRGMVLRLSHSGIYQALHKHVLALFLCLSRHLPGRFHGSTISWQQRLGQVRQLKLASRGAVLRELHLRILTRVPPRFQISR